MSNTKLSAIGRDFYLTIAQQPLNLHFTLFKAVLLATCLCVISGTIVPCFAQSGGNILDLTVLPCAHAGLFAAVSGGGIYATYYGAANWFPT